MKTLSIQQPWASLIISGQKRVENRTWAPKHRGSLLIHAPKGYDKRAIELLDGLGIDYLGPDDAPRGVILGQVTLVDVAEWRPGNPATFFDMLDEHGLSEDPLAFGPVCWILEDPQPLQEPIPAKGKLSLWEFDLANAQGSMTNDQ